MLNSDMRVLEIHPCVVGWSQPSSQLLAWGPTGALLTPAMEMEN